MREIKFKVWIKEYKKMQKVIGIDTDLEFGGVEVWGKDYIDPNTGEHEADRDFYNWNEVEFREYTGLKDKNGSEIYEGDIIKVEWGATDDFLSDNKLDKPFVIEFRSYSWFPFSHYLPMPKDIEILGNIYENPELLSDGVA